MSSARDCECQIKMERNCLDSKAFGMVILRAKDVDADVLYMLF